MSYARSLPGRAIRAARAALPLRIDRPVFIIAPPRSGSTLVFDALAEFDELVCFHGREAEHLWWAAAPYAQRADISDELLPSEVSAWRRRLLAVDFRTEALVATRKVRARRALSSFDAIRYLDKTISNCFHLEVLDAMFPDAYYVHLVRDPRANIASMMVGWDDPRFVKSALSPVLDAADTVLRNWTYPAPPGWRGVLTRPLVDVCAWSWAEHARRVADHAQRRGAALLRYEDVIADPTRTLRAAAERLELQWTDRVAHRLADLPMSRTVVNAPSADKWREHADELAHVVPAVRDLAARIGYDL